MPPGQDKGAALELVLQKLGLPASSMVALGDGLNDLGMLRLAGTSIAMQNAVDAAKDVAGMVSEKSNDVRAPFTLALALLRSGSVPDLARLLLPQEAGWAHVLEQLGVVPAPRL